jgi:hypothetical protein
MIASKQTPDVFYLQPETGEPQPMKVIDRSPSSVGPALQLLSRRAANARSATAAQQSSNPTGRR